MRIAHYHDVPDERWNDWRWQQRHRVTALEELSAVVEVTEDERRAFDETVSLFRMAITPYYLELIDPQDPDCPVRRQAVPALDELRTWPGELSDPLAEEAHSPVAGLTHRYPDRALLYTTHNCPVYCRFCTRKRKVSDPTSQTAWTEVEAALEYVRNTPAIREVIVSGGDPLSLSNGRLAEILTALSRIPHVDVARIGTRNLVTLPMRIDQELADVLREHQSRHLAVWMMTHFNHVKECTDAAADAAARVLSTGTPIQNQMVLLQGVNDNADTVIALNRALLRMRVKPYYILHADMAQGIGHFRTTLETGREIMDALRGHVSGLAVPQYVVDLPTGGGKVPVIPKYELSSDASGTRFRNYAGRVITLDAPGD